MPEKRKYRRLSTNPLPSRVLQEGELLDLSIGGAFVTSDRPLPKGAKLILEFALPGHGAIRIGTVVEWAGDYFHGQGGQPCLGMGLSFVKIDATHRIAITRYLASIYEISRAAVRVKGALRARLNTGGTWSAALVHEVGERHLFLETSELLAIGAEVAILILLPQAKVPLEVRGVVLQVGTLSATARAHAALPGDGPDGTGATPTPDDPVGLRIGLSEVGLKARDLLRAFLEDARAEAAEEARGE